LLAFKQQQQQQQQQQQTGQLEMEKTSYGKNFPITIGTQHLPISEDDDFT
jgi:hypothetical protein